MITKIEIQDLNGILYDISYNMLKFSTFSSGKATSLEFKILTQSFEIQEGFSVALYLFDEIYFKGTIFEYSKEFDHISVIAYDNLIYFKSKDTLIVKNKTANTVISEICAKLNLTAGEFSNTEYYLPYCLYENTSYFDIFNDILLNTSNISSNYYKIYDNLGEIFLKPINFNTKLLEIDISLLLSYCERSSSQNIYNTVHIYQISATGNISSYYAYDYESIKTLGKIQKSLNVDRNLTSAQCNLIAKNTLIECEKAIFSYEIQIIATEIINIYDILLINDVKYRVISSILNINGNSETYTLSLEKELI